MGRAKVTFSFLGLIAFASGCFGQFSMGIGPDVCFLRTEEVYNLNALVYNENETYDLYGVNSQLAQVSPGFSVRSFGRQFTNPKKIVFGYSLEIGYRYFSSQSTFFYRASSTAYPDSIVNIMDGFTYKTAYHTLRFNHFLDVHWNPTKNIKITNSIGIGIGAIVYGKSPGLEFDGTIVNTNHPIVKFLYQPQITEKYDRFSLTYFTTIHIYAFPLFNKPNIYDEPDLRIPYEKLRFNAIGIRFVPHFKVKERPSSEMY